MEIVIAVAAGVQTITMIVIAWITHKYTHFTKVMLESNIEPWVDVGFCGDMDQNGIDVENDSGCRVRDVEVGIFIELIKEDKSLTGICRLFHNSWPRLEPGASVKTQRPLVTMEAIKSVEAKQPDGVTANFDDITVEYSFVREADMKRYCYQYRVRLLPQESGPMVFVPEGDPKRVRGLKKLMIGRTK